MADTNLEEGAENTARTSGDSGTEGKDWEKSYKGLQGVVAKKDGTIQTLASKIAELEAKVNQADSETAAQIAEQAALIERLNGSLAETRTTYESAQSKLQETESLLTVNEVLRDFPTLSNALTANEVKELAAAGKTAEEIRNSVKERDDRLKAVLEGLVEKRVSERMAGVTPRTGTPGAGGDLKEDPEFETNEEWRNYIDQTSDEKEKRARWKLYEQWVETQ